MARSEKMASAASPSENTENVMKKDMTAKADDNIVVLFLQPAADARSANSSRNLTTCLTKDGDGNVSDPNGSQVIKVVYKEQNVNVPRGSQMVQIGL